MLPALNSTNPTAIQRASSIKIKGNSYLLHFQHCFHDVFGLSGHQDVLGLLLWLLFT